MQSLCKKTGLLFLVFVGLISIVGTGKEDKKEKFNRAPEAHIISPSDDTVFTYGNSVTFTGSGTDPEQKNLTGGSLIWTSSLNDIIGSGTNFTTSSLSKGTHLITLTATDNKGLAASTSISITMNPHNNTRPEVLITSPVNGQNFKSNEFIQFSGTGYDAEDQWLKDGSLVWSSSLNGVFGSGESFATNTLKQGRHIITLKATDSEGVSVIASTSITIANTAPIATITYPYDGQIFKAGTYVPLAGEGFDEEDGELSGASLIWTINGHPAGTGETVSYYLNQTGQDIIVNLTARDSKGLVDTDTIRITAE